MLYQDGFFTDEEEGIEFDGVKASPIFAMIRLASEEQIRGLFARILRDARVPSVKAARTMRCGRTAYFEDLKTQFPGINSGPVPPKQRRREGQRARGE